MQYDTTKAEVTGLTVLRIDPDHADTHHNLGMALVKAGRDADAIASFQSYVALEPNVARGPLNLGMACRKADRRNDAIGAFKRAAELDSGGATGQEAKRYLQILREDD